jgi:hypothetical protein
MGYVVNGKLRVFAYPSKANPDNWHYEHTGAVRNRVAAKSPEYYFCQYDEPAELVTFCADLQQSETWIDQQTQKLMTHPVMETLEILAHGTPRKCDGLDKFMISFDDFAAGLNNLTWDDNSSIYLTGCNSGCRDTDDEQGVAEALAELIPSTPKKFRCTVYGTVGYHRGSHASGDGWATPDYEKDGVHYPNYPWQRHGRTDDTDPDPHMQSYRGFNGPNSA